LSKNHANSSSYQLGAAVGKLHRECRFADFSAAFAFMVRVALAAETLNHHPEWSNVWNRVVIDLTTHDTSGLSNLDLDLARRIDALLGYQYIFDDLNVRMVREIRRLERMVGRLFGDPQNPLLLSVRSGATDLATLESNLMCRGDAKRHLRLERRSRRCCNRLTIRSSDGWWHIAND
jgi:4a-hydroxytetrahydrobiopterin dehydratase